MPRAEIVVDGVADAPQRMRDVRDLDVDYYAFQYYKVDPFPKLLIGQVYRPHLYTRKTAQDKLGSLAHYLLNANSPGPLKLVPGGPNFELSYATSTMYPYLTSLSGLKEDQLPDREMVKKNYKPTNCQIDGAIT